LKLDVQRRTLAFERPVQAAYGVLTERELLAVSITGDDGIAGYGEAAPLEPYDGIGIDRAHEALARYAPILARSGRLNGAQMIDACRSVDDLPAALAAVDLALWDRAGRTRGMPVAALLTDDPAPDVPVNATISSLDRASVAEQAARAVREGFDCVKLKVAVGDDAGRVAAARAAAGPEIALRLDANGGWDVEQAVRTIDALAPAGLELVEEPVHGLHAVREVRERVAVRVAIDETAAEHGALGAGVADAVCLKISRCGGIGGLIAAATLVRASGAEPYISSTFDGPLGVAAGVHAAAALASRGAVPHCGLATLAMFAGIDDPLPARDGRIAVPTGAGLGVQPV
jgi:L-alanine-DL-glutamate epimerase-like enolase superfamily enzyme